MSLPPVTHTLSNDLNPFALTPKGMAGIVMAQLSSVELILSGTGLFSGTASILSRLWRINSHSSVGRSCVLSGVDTMLCGMLQFWTQPLSATHPLQQKSLECLASWQLGSSKTSLGLPVLRKLLYPRSSRLTDWTKLHDKAQTQWGRRLFTRENRIIFWN